MLIDTRTPPPDPDRGREPWLVSLVLDHLFPWPAIVVLLFAASLMTTGLIGAVLAWTAVLVAAWRMSRAFRGVGGLRDHIQ